MRIKASNPEHQRYSVLLDGVDISTISMEADDVANVVVVGVRNRQGQLIRCDGRPLTAVVTGKVTIIPSVNEPIEAVQ